MTNSPAEEGLAYRRRFRGLIGIQPKLPIRDTSTLSVVYTPGVAKPCLEIDKDHFKSYDYTIRGNTIAVISDGSSVYGLGNTGPSAAIPMLESKCVFHKTYAGIDAFPLALDTQDVDELVEVIRYLPPTFGGIHLEDISSPRCFALEERLKRAISLPLFHADQQGASIVSYAALLNGLKLVDKSIENIRVVISGAGAAGLATARFLKEMGVGDVKVCDRNGALYYRRLEGLNWIKSEVARLTNPEDIKGSLADVIKGADVFFGFSSADVLTPDMVKSMATDPFVFALANPNPEISYEAAKEAGAKIVATGRSDYPNQINSTIIYPGIFRGALDVRATTINQDMCSAAARALAGLVADNQLSPDYIMPNPLEFHVSAKLARAVAQAAMDSGAAQHHVDACTIEDKVMTYIYEGTNAWVNPPSKQTYDSLEEESLDLHNRYHGVIEIKTKLPIRDHYIYKTVYSVPWAALPCQVIRDNPETAYDLTVKNNLVAIVTDGSAVLGLGNLGPAAAMPVMEGKAVLFKSFGGVEAFPICLRTQNVDDIVEAVKAIAPVFGGVNLEDISAPRCFEIEQRLSEALDIPIFHDDQHGTAVVVMAGILNALKIVEKPLASIRIVINGAGAAALSVTQLLLKAGAKDITICDSKGTIYQGRQAGMNPYKERIAAITNLDCNQGSLAEVMKGADVFIGLSVPGTVNQDMVKSMAANSVIMALSNPVPEIMPDEAYAAGAKVVATGRSDFPNQVNNSLAFPGIFRGALDVRARHINDDMKLAAGQAIADLISDKQLKEGTIIPGAFDFRVPPAVAQAVARAAMDTGESRISVKPADVHSELKNYLYEGELKKVTEVV
ncbi:MAG: NADP-dependent malic enzyme [Cyanobacteria bacterium HKST-UBA05]|nr:NADP-dependent malic enzyme [Cyanobacteria bacterium HKST-UBA05]